jgi:hypothetical protein
MGLVAVGCIYGQPQTLENRTIILSKKNDPFYPLAIEISKREGIPVVNTLDAVTRSEKEFLLWVISPGFMSDEVIVSFSTAMKSKRNFPSSGIISGSTIEMARALFYRGRERIEKHLQKNAGMLSIAYADNYKLLVSRGSEVTEIPFDKKNFTSLLPKTDILFFWGHGGSTYFRIKKTGKFISRDIPDLPGTIIKSGSCNSFRLWSGQSIALHFANKGAAAFFGYSYSPAPFYLLGYFKEPPLINSFKQVPLGHIVHMQNNADLKAFARIPYLFLLGDPRIFLQSYNPYTLIDDIEGADRTSRILKFRSSVKGFIPVYIPDGSRYDFLEIVSPDKEKKNRNDSYSFWEHSPWYHSKIQTLNFHQDKFILFEHHGGEFTIKLRIGAPSFYPITHTLLNSLDYSFIFCAQTGGDVISLFFIVILSIWFIVIKKKISLPVLKESLVKGVCAGAVFSLFLFFYTGIRAQNITIISSSREFSWFTIIIGFFLVALSAALYFQSKKKWTKILCFSILLSPVLITIIVWTSSILYGNIMASTQIKKAIYNGSVVYLSLITMTIEIVFFTLLFLWLTRIHVSYFFKWLNRRASCKNPSIL